MHDNPPYWPVIGRRNWRSFELVGRNQLSASLSSKLDRQDLGRIAALIANGELEGINPAAELLRREFL